MNTTILIEVLLAGVIAALVTGIFSLVIAVKSNRRSIELEKNKQKFTVDQERYKELRDAYEELLKILPREKFIGHIISNLPSKNDFQKKSLPEYFRISGDNMKILYCHFQKYCYLLSESEQKTVDDSIAEIDDVTKSIVDFDSEIQKYDNDDKKNRIEVFDIIQEKMIEGIIKVSEFEKMYYDFFINNLTRISNLDSKG